MKIVLRGLLPIIFLLGISMPVLAQKGTPTAEASVDNIEAALRGMREMGFAKGVEPSEGKRYIMTVTSRVKVTASDFIGTTSSPKLSNDLVIILTGIASPSSPEDFTKAFLIFRHSASELRSPSVVQRQGVKELYIYYPFEYAATLERTFSEGKAIYAWIGNFGNSVTGTVNMHADVHVSY